MEILSSADFSMISMKHSQLFEINIPGQDIQRPKKNPENKSKKNRIF